MAASIRSSGSEAPSRKEKAEAACSSTYSVINPVGPPLVPSRVVVDAVERAVRKLHVPIIPQHRLAEPPAVLDAPGPRGHAHLPHDLGLRAVVARRAQERGASLGRVPLANLQTD